MIVDVGPSQAARTVQSKPGLYRVYLDPIKPTFLGIPIKISLYKSMKRYIGYVGLR